MTAAPVPPDYVDRPVRVKGLSVYTRRRDGAAVPPLVLLNGLGGSLTAWRPLLENLPHRDVVMLDTPGAGRSSTPRFPLRIPTLARTLGHVLDRLRVDRADVLGYSLGGTLAQELAHRRPHLVRRLILVATIFGIGSRPVPLRTSRTLISTRRYRDREVLARVLPGLAGGRTARDPQVLGELLDAREGYPPTARGYYYQQLSLTSWSSWPWLRRLECPTLVLQGSDDPVVPIGNARLLARRIPHARLEIVDGGGHLMLFDDAGTVAPRIEQFLTEPTRY